MLAGYLDVATALGGKRKNWGRPNQPISTAKWDSGEYLACLDDPGLFTHEPQSEHAPLCEQEWK
jgi:hypothetical protein